jgi:hypothetical protein
MVEEMERMKEVGLQSEEYNYQRQGAVNEDHWRSESAIWPCCQQFPSWIESGLSLWLLGR